MDSYDKYKLVTAKLLILYNKYTELIYLCDNFDINRINNFLINIIEYHNFYIYNGDKGELSNGYSDMSDIERLSSSIIATDDYTNMITYMKKNFSNIFEKYQIFISEIDEFIYEYNNYIINKENIDLIEKTKDEYKFVISNLEELEQRLLEIIDNNIIPDTLQGININVVLITNNSLIYKTIGYWVIKKLLIKNLHIINKEAYEISNSDFIEFKNKFYKIYLNVYKEFLIKLKEDIEIFDTDFINNLKNKININKYREILKKIMDLTAQKETENNKADAEDDDEDDDEAGAEAEDTKKYKLEEKRVDKEIAEKKYELQLEIVSNLKDKIKDLKNTST